MISYIFKSRAKNILFTCSVTILLFLALRELYNYILFDFSTFSVSLVRTILCCISYLFVFIYMLTLKRKFFFKNWLFPACFLTLSLFVIISFTISTNSLSIYPLPKIVQLIILINNSSFSLFIYVLCFIGSLSNFKRLSLFRIGIAVFLGDFVFKSTVNTIQSIIYLTKGLSIASFLESSIKILAPLFFYVSLLILTFTKKSDNIDITPFAKAREAKRALKKQQKDTVEVYVPPVVPDNCWRCMGCDNILPDDIDQCECGYKRQQ